MCNGYKNVKNQQYTKYRKKLLHAFCYVNVTHYFIDKGTLRKLAIWDDVGSLIYIDYTSSGIQLQDVSTPGDVSNRPDSKEKGVNANIGPLVIAG